MHTSSTRFGKNAALQSLDDLSGADVDRLPRAETDQCAPLTSLRVTWNRDSNTILGMVNQQRYLVTSRTILFGRARMTANSRRCAARSLKVTRGAAFRVFRELK